MPQEQEQTKKLYQTILITGIILVAFNLRPAITSIGPIIGVIRDDTGLTNSAVGLLTSLPLVAFAIMSPIAPKIANRYTNEIALLIGLIILFIGIQIRSISIIGLIFAGTLLVGFGIAILNVLLPSVIKDKFPLKIGLMTSVYTTAMGIIAALASGLSVPLAVTLDWGWQLTLLFWAIPSILGAVFWIYLALQSGKDKQKTIYQNPTGSNISTPMWKSTLAWQIAFYMGLQSFLFYTIISWLPEILHSSGLNMTTAGWMLSFAQVIGLPASFVVPILAERATSQRGIVAVLVGAFLAGASGLLLFSTFWLLLISSMLIGISMSGFFSLALTFIGIRARTARQAARLSGMAQSCGYILAALGPISIGFLFDLSGNWTIPVLTMMFIAILVLIFGFGASRNQYVLSGEQ